MRSIPFGYAGKWCPTPQPVREAAYWVKSDPTPVGVEQSPPRPYTPPFYRVVTNQEYRQAQQAGRLRETMPG